MGAKSDSKLNGLPPAMESERLSLQASTWVPPALCRNLFPKDNNPAREPGRGPDAAEASLSGLFSAVRIKVKSKRRGEKRSLEKSVLCCPANMRGELWRGEQER